MYYTTSGAYRKTKMIIDYSNVLLTIIIGLIFIAIVFLRSRAGLLFSLEFLLGAVVNGLTATKSFLDNRAVSGAVLSVVTIGLLIASAFAFKVML